jgi:hypothetical protein
LGKYLPLGDEQKAPQVRFRQHQITGQIDRSLVGSCG